MSRDGFLERWSRRKLADNKEPEPEAEQPAEAAAPVDEPDEEELDEEELAKLPSLESFTVKTDLAPFLRKGVPQALKNAAMRKMWMLDPAVRDHVDFAVDYAWDWNTPGGVPGNAGTISQDSITRMMDALKPKPKPEPEAEKTIAGVPDEPEAKSAIPEAQAKAETEAPQEAVEDDAPAKPEDPRDAPRPRRHGGAAPA
ncbi:MAG TPA: DUF3306 domain-containing protein [Aestuariivirgaceae bacterium]|nr:DUF3306 domain-containing protein [Aestuariivirgaceae bacterium]